MKNTLNTLKKNAAWFDLDELGIIMVTGNDRCSFLNGQLTQDMATLSGDRTFLCAYCTPKGRVIALLRAWNTEDTLYLMTEKTLVLPVIERLQKFIFRADVAFENASETWGVMGVQVDTLSSNFPENSETFSVTGGVTLLRIEHSENRGMMVFPKETFSSVLKKLNLAELPQAKASQWACLDILEGLPRIVAACSEKYLVQALNLDRLNGVSFTKGCYVGQEIVARMHYLGKNKQRMVPAVLDGSAPNNGELIKRETGKKIAEVVFTQAYEDKTLAQLVIGSIEMTGSILMAQDNLSVKPGTYSYLKVHGE